MWTKEKKDILSVIYGDDLVLMGDVLLARNIAEQTCRVINQDGDMLINSDVLGVGYVLRSCGWGYLVFTKRKIYEQKTGGGSFVSPMANSKYYSNYLSNKGNARGFANQLVQSSTKASYTEYDYQIFNSKFEFVKVGKARSNKIYSPNLTVDIGGKLITVNIADCIVTQCF